MWIKTNIEPSVDDKIMLRGYKKILSQPVGVVYYSDVDGYCVSFDFTFGGYFWMPISNFKEWTII